MYSLTKYPKGIVKYNSLLMDDSQVTKQSSNFVLLLKQATLCLDVGFMKSTTKPIVRIMQKGMLPGKTNWFYRNSKQILAESSNSKQVLLTN